MKKLSIILLLLCSVVSCETTPESTREEQTETQEEFLAKNKLEIPTKEALKELTPVQSNLVKDWLEFQVVYQNMKNINSSTRFSITEDLGQLATNIDSIELKKIPKDFDIMQIRSRFTVLKTKALKLQDDASDESVSNNEVVSEIVEMNSVFNTINNQIVQTSKTNFSADEILRETIQNKDSIAEKPVQKPVAAKKNTTTFQQQKPNN